MAETEKNAPAMKSADSQTIEKTPASAPEQEPQEQPVQEKDPCRYCKKLLVRGTRYCNDCKHYQDWRRFLFFFGTVLTQLVSLITIVGALFAAGAYLYKNFTHSHTSLTVKGANDNEIYVHVSNNGWRSSILHGYRLKFDELPILDVPLDVVGADRREIGTVPAKDTIKFALTTTGLRKRTKTVTKKEILRLLSSHSVKLEIDVQESSDPHEGPWQVRSERFPAELIRRLLEEKLPDDEIY